MGPPYCHPIYPNTSCHWIHCSNHFTIPRMEKAGFCCVGEKKDDSLGNLDQSRSRLNWIPRQKRGC